MSDIATKVKAIIIDKLGVDEKEVTNEASFTNDLGADSLDTVELIMEFEKEFFINIFALRMELKRVVVTGLGALTPLGNSVADYWNGLINGVSGADFITL